MINNNSNNKSKSVTGTPRDVNYRPSGTGGASEVPEEKARLTDGKSDVELLYYSRFGLLMGNKILQ
jgi:hypothetical protein